MSSVALEPRTFRDTAPLLRRARVSRAMSLLILLLLAAAAVAPAATRGRLFPRPTRYVATMQYVAERLRAGELPLWNPHEHLGEPVARDGRSATWYPATLVLLALRQPLAWHVIAALHLWLAGVGAWMLGGRYGLEPVPRLVTAVAYTLCGVNVLGLESAQANVTTWLPWAALAVERLGERVTALRILFASLVLTVQFLGGDLLASAALVLTCTLALLIRAFWIGPGRWAAAVVACAVALAIAVAASAVQWVPAVMPWRVTPLLALSDVPRTWPWGAGPWIVGPTAPALFGAIPLALSAIAVLAGRRPRAVVLWTVTAAVLALLVIACEVATRWPGGAEALRTWPRPRVLIAGVSLGVAVLAGFGVETIAALAAPRAAHVRRTLAWAAAVLAAVAVVATAAIFRMHDYAGSRHVVLHGARLLVAAAMLGAAALVVRSHELPQWRSRGWAWAVLVSAELLAFALPATRGVAIREFAAVGEVAAFLRAQREPGRFIDASGRLPAAVATWQSLEDAGGAGRGSLRYEAWSAAALASGGRNGPDPLRVANVRYVATAIDAPPPPQPWRRVHAGASVAVYADEQPLPRAWVAPQGKRVSSPRDALSPLTSSEPVDPRAIALLDDADVTPQARRLIQERPDYWTASSAADGSGRDAAYAAASPEEVRVRVGPGGAGWLVIADAFATGWRATVDGRPEPVVPAFGALRAVRVPAGGGEVTLRYEPPMWREIVLVAGGGGGAMLLLLAWSLLRPRPVAARLSPR